MKDDWSVYTGLINPSTEKNITMKYLYETILDADKLEKDIDITIGRLYVLPDELNKEYGRSWEVTKDTLTLVDAVDFRIDDKFLEIIEKYQIHKLIFPSLLRIYVSGPLNLTKMEIVSRTKLDIRCSELKLNRCKLSASYSTDINCTKLSLASCEVETPRLHLFRLSWGSFNFGNSRMKVERLYIHTADEEWLDHLKNLGVRKTYTIMWFASPGEYSHIDPLAELGLNPKQWKTLDRFGIEATRNDLWGISTRKYLQFCWSRHGMQFAAKSPGKPNEYFLGWDQFEQLNEITLM